MNKFREFMEILTDNPGASIGLFLLIVFIISLLVLVFRPMPCSGATLDEQVNTWLSNIDESVAKLEITSVRGQTIYKATGYSTGTVYFFSTGTASSFPYSDEINPPNPPGSESRVGDPDWGVYSTVFQREGYGFAIEERDQTEKERNPDNVAFWIKFHKEHGIDLNLASPEVWPREKIMAIFNEAKSVWPKRRDGVFNTSAIATAELTVVELIKRGDDPSLYSDFKDMIRFERTQSASSSLGVEIYKLGAFVDKYAPSQREDYEMFAEEMGAVPLIKE